MLKVFLIVIFIIQGKFTLKETEIIKKKGKRKCRGETEKIPRAEF